MMNIFLNQTLTCHPTEYVFGDECCPMCPIGTRVKTDCEEDKTTSCQLCTEGTYNNGLNGFKLCYPCRECGAGKLIPAGTSSTDTMCSTCSDGTFSDGTFTSCQNHKQCESEGLLLLRAGTETEDAQCGDIPSDWTGLIVGVVVVLLVLVLVLTAWCYRVKIKRFLNRSKNL
ncbi:tumor necrosis factor receptor superfamily member 5-like [Labrus bergylta]|uniref:tumor necrosis factor receptor superfamily member 5-like n=1 Tax=Labrus bergylta TaxID=56723 RepID=UPI00331440D3